MSLTLLKSFINVRENRLRMDNQETMDETNKAKKKKKKKKNNNKKTTIKQPKNNEQRFS